MATIKSYTDIEQSKKLAEILPKESADMFYATETSTLIAEPPYEVEGYKPCIPFIPCWSLAALLRVLPEPDLIQNSEGKWTLISWDKSRFPWRIGNHVDPVDACVEMILKLHKLKML